MKELEKELERAVRLKDELLQKQIHEMMQHVRGMP